MSNCTLSTVQRIGLSVSLGSRIFEYELCLGFKI